MRSLYLLLLILPLVTALRCYEGTVGLDSNQKTEEKQCAISSYCLQYIDKEKNEIRRGCSTFTDEHNMEERCPMTGCHWQSTKQTFCCCQFDLCNEWKSNGDEFKKGEMISATSSISKTVDSNNNVKTTKAPKVKSASERIAERNFEVRVPTTPVMPAMGSKRRNSEEVDLD